MQEQEEVQRSVGVVIIGDAGTGRRSFLRSFVDGREIPPSEYHLSADYPFVFEGVRVGEGGACRFSVQILSSPTDPLLTKEAADIVFLCYSIDRIESFERLEEWLPTTFQRFDCLISAVGLKSDLRDASRVISTSNVISPSVIVKWSESHRPRKKSGVGKFNIHTITGIWECSAWKFDSVERVFWESVSSIGHERGILLKRSAAMKRGRPVERAQREWKKLDKKREQEEARLRRLEEQLRSERSDEQRRIERFRAKEDALWRSRITGRVDSPVPFKRTMDEQRLIPDEVRSVCNTLFNQIHDSVIDVCKCVCDHDDVPLLAVVGHFRLGLVSIVPRPSSASSSRGGTGTPPMMERVSSEVFDPPKWPASEPESELVLREATHYFDLLAVDVADGEKVVGIVLVGDRSGRCPWLNSDSASSGHAVSLRTHVFRFANSRTMSTFVEALVTATSGVTDGWPDSSRLFLGSGVKKHVARQEADKDGRRLGGFREAYLAVCNYINVPAYKTFLTALSDRRGPCEEQLNLSRIQPLFENRTFDVRSIAGALCFNAFFDELVLENFPRVGAAYHLFSTFAGNRNIKRLVLRRCRILEDDVKVLADAAIANPEMELNSLDLSMNPLCDIGFQHVAVVARILPLEVLKIARCSGTEPGLMALFEGMHKNRRLRVTLKHLDLSENRFGRLGSEGLAKWVTSAPFERERGTLVEIGDDGGEDRSVDNLVSLVEAGDNEAAMVDKNHPANAVIGETTVGEDENFSGAPALLPPPSTIGAAAPATSSGSQKRKFIPFFVELFPEVESHFERVGIDRVNVPVMANTPGSRGDAAMNHEFPDEEPPPFALTVLKVAKSGLDIPTLLAQFRSKHRYFPNLERLDVSFNPHHEGDDSSETDERRLSRQYSLAVSSFLSKFERVWDLNVSGCNMTPVSFGLLLERLLEKPALRMRLRLVLNFNQIGSWYSGAPPVRDGVKDEGNQPMNRILELLHDGLFVTQTLRAISLEGCDLSNDELFRVCRAFDGAPSLETVGLGGNYMFNPKTAAFVGARVGEFLQRVPKLRKLSMRGFTFDQRGSRRKGPSSAERQELRVLGGKGISSLLAQIEDHASITHLDISGNRMGNEGALALARYLHANDKLLSLEFDDNDIRIEGYEALLKALGHNHTLQALGPSDHDVRALHPSGETTSHSSRRVIATVEAVRRVVSDNARLARISSSKREQSSARRRVESLIAREMRMQQSPSAAVEGEELDHPHHQWVRMRCDRPLCCLQCMRFVDRGKTALRCALCAWLICERCRESVGLCSTVELLGRVYIRVLGARDLPLSGKDNGTVAIVSLSGQSEQIETGGHGANPVFSAHADETVLECCESLEDAEVTVQLARVQQYSPTISLGTAEVDVADLLDRMSVTDWFALKPAGSVHVGCNSRSPRHEPVVDHPVLGSPPFGTGSVERRSHMFIDTYFASPTYCQVCGHFLWGIIEKQGMQCSMCGLIAHFKCGKDFDEDHPCGSRQGGRPRSEPIPESFQHQWEVLHPKRPLTCFVCRRTLWGAGCVKCSVCRVSAHFKCQTGVPHEPCRPLLLGHSFRRKKFPSVQTCGHCHQMLVGLATHGGAQCERCGLVAHSKCMCELTQCCSWCPDLPERTAESSDSRPSSTHRSSSSSSPDRDRPAGLSRESSAGSFLEREVRGDVRLAVRFEYSSLGAGKIRSSAFPLLSRLFGDRKALSSLIRGLGRSSLSLPWLGALLSIAVSANAHVPLLCAAVDYALSVSGNPEELLLPTSVPSWTDDGDDGRDEEDWMDKQDAWPRGIFHLWALRCLGAHAKAIIGDVKELKSVLEHPGLFTVGPQLFQRGVSDSVRSDGGELSSMTNDYDEFLEIDDLDMDDDDSCPLPVRRLAKVGSAVILCVMRHGIPDLLRSVLPFLSLAVSELGEDRLRDRTLASVFLVSRILFDALILPALRFPSEEWGLGTLSGTDARAPLLQVADIVEHAVGLEPFRPSHSLSVVNPMLRGVAAKFHGWCCTSVERLVDPIRPVFDFSGAAFNPADIILVKRMVLSVGGGLEALARNVQAQPLQEPGSPIEPPATPLSVSQEQQPLEVRFPVPEIGIVASPQIAHGSAGLLLKSKVRNVPVGAEMPACGLNMLHLLPQSLASRILFLLPVRSLALLSFSCQEYRRLVASRAVWRLLCKRAVLGRSSSVISHPLLGESVALWQHWKETYRELTRETRIVVREARGTGAGSGQFLSHSSPRSFGEHCRDHIICNGPRGMTVVVQQSGSIRLLDRVDLSVPFDGRRSAVDAYWPSDESLIPSTVAWMSVDGTGYGGILCVLRNGGLLAWGPNAAGQLGVGHVGDAVPVPTRIRTTAAKKMLPRIAHCVCGRWCSLICSVDGDVFACGTNRGHVCGIGGEGEIFPSFAPVILPANVRITFVAVAAGNGAHAAALSEDGRVFCWGANESGQLGVGDYERRISPTEIIKREEIGPVLCVALGESHSMFVTGRGLQSCGRNDRGQCGWATSDEFEDDEDEAEEVKFSCCPLRLRCLAEERVVQVACGPNHSLVFVATNRLFLLGRVGRADEGPSFEELSDCHGKAVLSLSCTGNSPSLGVVVTSTWNEAAKLEEKRQQRLMDVRKAHIAREMKRVEMDRAIREREIADLERVLREENERMREIEERKRRLNEEKDRKIREMKEQQERDERLRLEKEQMELRERELQEFKEREENQRHQLEEKLASTTMTLLQRDAVLGDLRDEKSCIICFERDREAVCIPCMHAIMCEGCANAVVDQRGTCPVCNMPIAYMQRIFFT